MLDLAEKIAKTYLSGGKVLVFGNGGLAAEAEHFAAELMGKFGWPVYIPCFALTSPSALITALGNDIGFGHIFTHQVETLTKPGDIVIGMTTSQSPNIIEAVSKAKKLGATAIVLCSNWSEIKETGIAIIRMPGIDIAAVQNEIIKYLHNVAREAKELSK